MNLAILLLASGLTIDDPPAPEPTHWYGGQTLLADAAALTLFTVAELQIASQGGDQSKCPACSALYVATFTTYLAAAPIVHVVHGRSGTALADFALRLGLPVGGGLLGAALASGQGGLASTGGGVIGGTLGVVSAVIVDAAVLANEPIATEPSISGGVAWMVGPGGKRRPTLVLAGTF